jgi:hypothetical protein
VAPKTDAFPFGPGAHYALALTALRQPRADIGPRRGQVRHARVGDRAGTWGLQCLWLDELPHRAMVVA